MWIVVYIWMTIILAVATFTGCIEEDALLEECPPVEEQAENVIVGFRMALTSCGIPGTRAEGDVPLGQTPGTSRENAVNTIDLLVFDADTDLLVDRVALDKTQISEIVEPNTLYVPIYAPTARRVKVYAAVNMTDAMRSRFVFGKTGSDLSLSSDRSDYWEVIDDFVPGSAGLQEQLEAGGGSGIPMTGQFFVTGTLNGVIELDGNHTTIDTALQVEAQVGRMVAKIHVLVSSQSFTLSDGSRVDYAHAQDRSMQQAVAADEDYANWIGWIRLADVRYMPNATNRSSYIFPQSTGRYNYPLWRDLNMNLSNYIIGGQFDAPMWTRDYVFYNGLSLHRENISASCHLACAEAFSQERLNKTNGTNDPDRYTRGMYCLENYFNNPTETMFQTYDDAIPMITHVSIAARLTPRNIVVVNDFATMMDAFVKKFRDNPEEFRLEYDFSTEDFTAEDVQRWGVIKERYFTAEAPTYRGDFRIVNTLTEADAADIINWSLKHNKLWSPYADDFENNKYPDATFYVYDTRNDGERPSVDQQWEQRYLYLTAGAVARASDDNIRIKTYSVPHLGGWGYYYTYLDQTGSTSNKKTPYSASQVTRNVYYLITVDNFGVPGGTITRPEYIKVNTVPVGWDYSGKGNINLH